jgi:hypothetical protein
VGIAVAAAPAILAEEYRRRRASPAPATGKAERRKSPR